LQERGLIVAASRTACYW